MTCGKKSNNAPTEEFILASPAPVDVAAKISALYRELSVRVGLYYLLNDSYTVCFFGFRQFHYIS